MINATRILWFFILSAVACTPATAASNRPVSFYSQATQSDADQKSNDHFKVDKNDLYSLAHSFLLADSLSGKNLALITQIRVKAPANNGAMLVLSIVRNDSTLLWHGINFSAATDSLQWISLHDTILIPASVSKKSSLQYYVWNPAQSIFYMNAPQIELNKHYLPEFTPSPWWDAEHSEPKVIFRNAYYQLLYDSSSGYLWIGGSAGAKVLGPLLWWHESVKPAVTLSSAKWNYLGFAAASATISFAFSTRVKGERVRLTITANKLSGQISIAIQSRFTSKTNVWRQALIAPYHGSVNQVFRQNALVDVADFQKEYYLGRGGAMIDDLAFVHNTSLGSVQLNTEKKIIVFNLDYADDHPLIYYPLSESKENHFEDIAYSPRRKKQQIVSTIDLFVGTKPLTMPRPMQVPGGFQSAIIWTEHADWADIRTHRAVNFGHDSITDANAAVGGFVYYDMPVTRSVFYHNPDKVTNSQASSGLFKGLHSSIRTDSAFYSLLKQLHHIGHEICLHSPEQYTSSRKWMKEALQFMQLHFGSPSWIDHGYNNSSTSNRENLVGDGLRKGSQHFSADLWKDYGVKYFWNPSLEENSNYNQYGFYGHLMIPYPGFGDAFPVQTASRHPARLNGWLWNTTGTLEVPNDGLWDYYFHSERIESLIAFNSVWINHVYPSWTDERKGFWQFDGQGGIQAMPGFNRALQQLAAYRQQGLVLPITIQQFLDYREAVDALKIIPIEANKVLIVNQSGKPIKDLSLAVRAESVQVDGVLPASKRRGGDIIFWFDMEAAQTAVITFE